MAALAVEGQVRVERVPEEFVVEEHLLGDLGPGLEDEASQLLSIESYPARASSWPPSGPRLAASARSPKIPAAIALFVRLIVFGFLPSPTRR
jgi:hypothetical protein